MLELFPKVQNTFSYVNGNIMKINGSNLLDQYFTKDAVAKTLYKKARDVISKHDGDIDRFHWIEPSADNGSFFKLLPKNKRTGMDIDPSNDEVIKKDYLTHGLPKNKNIVVIGNPPFGHRGVTALDFINHSKNSDYVCFILPMFFESNGKGSIKYRVKGLNLIHSEALPKNSFYDHKNQKNIDINCVFQIWSKNHKLETDGFNWYSNKGNEPFRDIIKVVTVSLAKNRECGKKWIFEDKADFYISSTFYNDVSIVDSFDQVKYKSGIAVIILDEKLKGRIMEIFKNTDWAKYSSRATNSCRHLGKSHIFQVMQDNIKWLK